MGLAALRVEEEGASEIRSALDLLLEAVGVKAIDLVAPGHEEKWDAAEARGDSLPMEPITEVLHDAVSEALPLIVRGQMAPPELGHVLGEALVEAARSIIEEGMADGPPRSAEWNATKSANLQPRSRKTGRFQRKRFRMPQPRNLIASGDMVDSLAYELEEV